MTIGYDGSRAFVKNRTGTENYSYQLLKYLSRIDKSNHYKVYIRFINDTIIELMKLFPKNFEFVEIKWKRLWTQGGLAIRTFTDGLDILFVPSHTLPIIRRPILKTVMTVHDLGAEYLPKMHQLKQRLYLNWITKYQLKSATRLIAVSKATKADLIKKAGISPDKIKVVYEGYDKNKFKVDTLVNGLKPYYLFVGTVQPRKNVGRLIEAFAKGIFAPSLVIVGSKGWLADEIYKLPKKLGMRQGLAPSALEKRVKFLGYVPDKAMPALYSGAEALLFPSLFEGFGLPILEAQACGCPVLTSNTSSMPEVAGKGAVLVNPYSIEDIIRGIREIGETREKLVKAGFENVKKFSWEKCAGETLEVLRQVTSNK